MIFRTKTIKQKGFVQKLTKIKTKIQMLN